MFRCYSAYSLITSFTLLLPYAYHFIPALVSTTHKCTQPCYFFPAPQTCCSEGEDGMEFFDVEFYVVCCPGCRSCGVMESSAVLFHFVRDVLVFTDIIYVIIILYS
jgi:hypothetical protein